MKKEDKAKELIGIYREKLLKIEFGISGLVIEELSKQCASIAVDEIILQLKIIYKNWESISNINYWKEVKQEIKTL